MSVRMNVRNQAEFQIGGTMIEVLVTIVITAIGLLGLSVLQNTSIKVSYDSYVRTQVAFIGADLADRVRANLQGGVYNLAFGDDAAGGVECQQTTSTCTPADLRQYDLFNWQQNARDLLPNADVAVEFDPTGDGEGAENGGVYTVSVTWEDRTDNDEVAGDDADAKTYQYFFRI